MPEKQRKCPHCNQQHPAEAIFCPTTGRAISPEKKMGCFPKLLSTLVTLLGLALVAFGGWYVFMANPHGEGLLFFLSTATETVPTATFTKEAATATLTEPHPTGETNELELTITTLEAEKAIIEVTATALALEQSLVPTSTSNPVNNPFLIVSLQPIANHRMDHLIVPLSGNVLLGDIPFNILSGQNSIFQSQHHLLTSNPTQAVLEVNVLNPKAVYILVNGSYVYQRLDGLTTGSITLHFASGLSITQNLIVGQNVRENWGFNNGTTGSGANEVITIIEDSDFWKNVYQESQTRSNTPATAFIDMLIIPIQYSVDTALLTQIELTDISADSFNLLAPSLIIYAITVESYP